MIARVWCFLMGFAACWLFLGCRLAPPQIAAPPPPTAVMTQVPPTAVITPSPTPPKLPDNQVPTPTVGRGTVFGQVLRPDGTAAVAVAVAFCQDFTLYAGCGQERYEAMTAEDGTFLITDVEPGQYALALYPEGMGGTVQFASDEALRVKLFGMQRNHRRFVEPMFLLADAPRVIGPRGWVSLLPVATPSAVDEALVGMVVLQWEPLPQTAVYEVYLAPAKGAAVLVNERVEGGRVTAVLPRLNCLYNWHVAAFNQADIKIAQTQNITFTMTGEDVGCDVALLPPQNGQTISETIKPVILDWEPHDLADNYRIWLIDSQHPQRPPILDFEEVVRSRYELPNGLMASSYAWAVVVYDENGRMLAESEIDYFAVNELGEIKP